MASMLTVNLLALSFCHALWNITVGVVHGSAVSVFIFPISLVDLISEHGKEYLSGGHFGVEASIIATVIGAFVIAGLFIALHKGHTRLTSEDL
ncbi:hypothetical protein [Corynebacterium falsenii]|uniref:hypothetical protein n=1 Tax=Corynebacterium falsenii TaxID=108486 RepID=UPI003FD58243